MSANFYRLLEQAEGWVSQMDPESTTEEDLQPFLLTLSELEEHMKKYEKHQSAAQALCQFRTSLKEDFIKDEGDTVPEETGEPEVPGDFNKMERSDPEESSEGMTMMMTSKTRGCTFAIPEHLVQNLAPKPPSHPPPPWRRQVVNPQEDEQVLDLPPPPRQPWPKEAKVPVMKKPTVTPLVIGVPVAKKPPKMTLPAPVETEKKPKKMEKKPKTTPEPKGSESVAKAWAFPPSPPQPAPPRGTGAMNMAANTAKSSWEAPEGVAKKPMSRTQLRRALHKNKEARSGTKYLSKRKRQRRVLNHRLSSTIPELVALIRAAVGDATSMD